MRTGKIISISLIIVLLIPTVSNGLRYQFKIPSQEEKPMILKKWLNLNHVVAMKQMEDDLYAVIMRGILIAKINLRTYVWKNVAELPLLQCFGGLLLLKYKNNVYTVFYELDDVSIYKIEENGTMMFKHRYSGVTPAIPLNSGTLTVISHTETQRVCSYNLENDKEKCFNLGYRLPYYIKIFSDNENVYFVYNHGAFHETDAYDYCGNYIWSITSPAIEYLSGSDENYVYAFLYDHSLAAINKYTGKIVWIIPNVRFTYRLSLSSGAIYVVSDYGSLLKISKRNGKILWTRNINVSSNIVKYGNYVLAYNYSSLYFITSTDGRIVWKISREDLGKNEGDWQIDIVTAGDDRITLAMWSYDAWESALYILGWPYDFDAIIISSSILLIVAAAGVISLRNRRMENSI